MFTKKVVNIFFGKLPNVFVIFFLIRIEKTTEKEFHFFGPFETFSSRHDDTRFCNFLFGRVTKHYYFCEAKMMYCIIHLSAVSTLVQKIVFNKYYDYQTTEDKHSNLELIDSAIFLFYHSIDQHSRIITELLPIVYFIYTNINFFFDKH